MKLNYLLYSRSVSRDYRWMIVPPGASPSDLRSLNSLYDIYDDYKEKLVFLRTDVLPIYCLNFPSIAVLVTCRQTEFKDALSRPIYSMQGVAVEHRDKRDFAAAIPYLLDDCNTSLNAWRKIDFEQADDISRSDLSDKVSLDKMRDNASENLRALQEMDEISVRKWPIELTFDADGFNSLLRLSVSSRLPLSDFAFGAMPEMLDKFNSFKIIAPVEIGYANKRVRVGQELDESGFAAQSLTQEKRFPQNEAEQRNTGNTYQQKPLIPSTMTDANLANGVGIDICEIGIARAPRTGLLSLIERDKYRFVLLDKDQKLVAESRYFPEPDDPIATASDKWPLEMAFAFRNFLESLKEKGWLELQERGQHKWSIRFYRKSTR